MVVEPLVGRLGLPVCLTRTNSVSGGRVAAHTGSALDEAASLGVGLLSVGSTERPRWW